MPQNSVKSFNIAIDARMYGTAQRGIGRYLMKLIENLEKIDPRPNPSPSGRGQGEGNHYTIFLRSQNSEEYTPKNPNFKKALWDAEWYGWREQLHFHTLIKPPLNLPLTPTPLPQGEGRVRDKGEKEGVDLFHFPHWNVPLFFRRPFVVTIHDLQLFSSSRVRESTTRGRLTYFIKYLCFKIIFRHAVLGSRAIIAPSNYVKERLAAKYPQARNKIRVIYEAPALVHSSQFTVHSKSKMSVNRELTTENFVLYVGAAYPHKNLERLFEAWRLVCEKLQGYKLVLVGREDYFWKKLKMNTPPLSPPPRGGEIIQFPPLPEGRLGGVGAESDNIIFYGETTDDELAALYQNASLLVQPSLEEGFSLTPLEALYFGCPVAVSDIPAHHEILGNFAAYFNPQDEKNMALAIENTLLNPLPKPGSDFFARYSWRAHANNTLHIYTDVVG